MNLHALHSLASFSTTFGHARYGHRTLTSSCPYFVQPPTLREQSLRHTYSAATAGAGGFSPSFVLLQWPPIIPAARRINLSEDYRALIIGY